jgi:serine/threonine protein kinase
MFMDEAKIAVLLEHPAIVRFYEFGNVSEQYYIAMEYVHGRDFDAVLKLTRRVGSRIPIGIALYVMLQVLEGLDYAHNKRDAAGQGLGIVHRDVSPANVLCGFDGQVKLTDFGIARAAVKVVATRPGLLLGKLGYMSPEQIKAERIDHRSDIFSAGVVLWEALAGRRLFHADNDAATIQNVVEAEIPSLRSLRSDVPPALDAAVSEALARDPRRRPARASELGARLRQILAQLDVSRPENDLIVFMAALFEGEPAGEPIFKR